MLSPLCSSCLTRRPVCLASTVIICTSFLLANSCTSRSLAAEPTAHAAATPPAATLPAGEMPPEFVTLPAKSLVRFRPTEAERQVPERFRLPPHEFSAQAISERETVSTRVFRVTFPSPVATSIPEHPAVHAKYFQPSGAGPFPGVVVLHILGGDFFLSETIAQHLAQHGIAALFVKMPHYGERRPKGSKVRMISDDTPGTVAHMTQAVLDIRRAAAFLATRPEIDAQQLGITGISLGGIMSALAGAAEPRFGHVAIYLAGGNFAQFIWNSDKPQAIAFRQQWLSMGETRESFLQLLAPVDPVTHGNLLQGRKVLMVCAEHDEVISPAHGRALFEAIGREPMLIWLNAGHISALYYLPRELVRLDLFFRNRLRSPPPK